MDIKLIMFKDTGERKEFCVEQGRTVIGRKDDCDLRVPLGEISRKHAMILVDGESVTVRDLGSSNGTYVNNKRIAEQELDAGDHLVIGPVVFTVQIDGEPTEVKPVHTRLEARSPLDRGRATPVPVGAGDDQEDAEDIFGEGDDDPISALEALAASDDTAAIDPPDSSFQDLEDSRA